ncbi:MAG: Ig-like domain-containing protein, partial [Dehalococcoidales bacterium]|nr:Ig-like domain-containing protein [Dehalococcoidales bacterium]
IYEGPETFNLNLTDPINATIADGQGIGTIIDGEDQLPAIGGIVYNAATLSPISGVTVNLTGAENRSTITNADGIYIFGNLSTGDYTVEEINPPGYTSVTPDTVQVNATSAIFYRVDFGDIPDTTINYIIISPDTATVTAGSSQAYTAEAFDAFGNSLGNITSGTSFSIQGGAGGSWSANVYTSENAGTWTVTGTYGGKTDTALLTVTAGDAGILVLEPATAINEINTNHELIATVIDNYGNPVPDEVVIWTIEDGPGSFISTETTTDSNGQARAVITSDTGGTTTVKASVSETVYDTATKTWSEEPLQYFTVDFLGEITSVPMSDDGSILEPLSAPNPDHTHWFEMEQGTRVLDDEGNIVTLIEIRITDDPPLEGNEVIVGDTYIINPPNVTFSQPVIFTLSYSVDELPEDVSTVSMSSYKTEIGWARLEAKGNNIAGVGELSSDIEASCVFAIIAGVTPQQMPASFALDTLTLNPSAIKFWDILTFAIRVGEDADVIVFVTNTGGQSGTYTANLIQNGNVIATQDVTLVPGERQMVSFDISGIEPGDYTIEIGDWSTEFTSTLWINWWLIAGLASALILIVWAAWYYGYYRRKQTIKKQ